MTKLQVISGGQTGVDQIGLRVSKAMNIPTGGTAPKGWLTENGPNPSLGTDYGLIEATKPGYPYRTRENVINSHGTVLFGNMRSVGSELTIGLCKDIGKPHLENPTPQQLARWIKEKSITILNVAGSRGSKMSYSAEMTTRHTLIATFILLGFKIEHKL